MIVGGDDETVIELNQDAAARMKNRNELSVVPGATHLFEEPGKLDQVCELAGDWFRLYLTTPSGTRR